MTGGRDGAGSSSEETVLSGGTANAGLVVRVGGTVRRPPSTAGTRALLQHLERAGFDGAPRHLGVDDRGRDILSYVEGEAATWPHPSWALTDQALVSVAELLRRYHRAVESFDPSGLPWPRPVPTAFAGRLVTHNDPNLDNVVFRDGRAAALIDFDLAGPGSAAWDVANAVRLWAPLRSEEDVPDERRGRSLERMALFVDAYGAARRGALPRGRGGPADPRLGLCHRPRGRGGGPARLRGPLDGRRAGPHPPRGALVRHQPGGHARGSGPGRAGLAARGGG